MRIGWGGGGGGGGVVKKLHALINIRVFRIPIQASCISTCLVNLCEFM